MHSVVRILNIDRSAVLSSVLFDTELNISISIVTPTVTLY